MLNYEMDLIERLKKIIGHEKPFAWAKRIGIPAPTFNRIWKSGGQLKSDHLKLIAEKTGISLHWLITGEGPMYVEQYNILEKAQFVREKPAEYDAEKYVKIPVISGAISAGTGIIPENMIESYCMFKREWILRKGDPKQMSLIRVRGDSMAPTLLEGDIVLINHAVREIYDGYIYAINIDEEVIIKRIFKNLSTNKIKIKSDNPDYEIFVIEKERVNINGLAVWYARELIK